MNVIEAMRVVSENEALEARCQEYRKYRDGDRLRHLRVNLDGVLVFDRSGFDCMLWDWTIYVRATGEPYVPPETTPAPLADTPTATEDDHEYLTSEVGFAAARNAPSEWQLQMRDGSWLKNWTQASCEFCLDPNSRWRRKLPPDPMRGLELRAGESVVRYSNACGNGYDVTSPIAGRSVTWSVLANEARIHELCAEVARRLEKHETGKESSDATR